jgi:hypothetical protein
MSQVEVANVHDGKVHLKALLCRGERKATQTCSQISIYKGIFFQIGQVLSLPALLIKISSLLNLDLNPVTNSRIDSKLARSSFNT